MSLDISWSDIINTDEYQDDLATLTELVVNSLGVEQLVDATNPFVFTVANLCAIHRYFIRHLPEIQDIDLTPFLSYIQNEIGLDLPLSPEMPVIEWLRENKHWLGGRGALTLYPFIGDLVGSALEVDFPNKLIMKLDSTGLCLSGKVTAHGEKPLAWNSSEWAHIRDGRFWAQFTYVVNVIQAQNLISTTDLINLLNNVHPAGTKMFLVLKYKWQMTSDEPEPYGQTGSFRKVVNSWWMPPWWPTLDNGFTLDTNPGPQLSQHGTGF